MQSKIEQRVMASVAVIHTARRATSRTALKLYALVASVYALGVLVWVSQVEANFLHAINGGALALGNYVLVALTHADVAVQAVLVVACVALMSLAVDLVRVVTQKQQVY